MPPPLKQFQTGLVTFDGTSQLLSTALGLRAGATRAYSIELQPGTANAAACYVGSDTVATTGIRLEAADAGIPPPPWVKEMYRGGELFLDQIYVRGANTETLRVLWIAYI